MSTARPTQCAPALYCCSAANVPSPLLSITPTLPSAGNASTMSLPLRPSRSPSATDSGAPGSATSVRWRLTDARAGAPPSAAPRSTTSVQRARRLAGTVMRASLHRSAAGEGRQGAGKCGARRRRHGRCMRTFLLSLLLLLVAAPAAAHAASIRIEQQGPNGEPITGGCYEAYNDDYSVERCDYGQDEDPGVILLPDLGTGTYDVKEYD